MTMVSTSRNTKQAPFSIVPGQNATTLTFDPSSYSPLNLQLSVP